MKAKTFKILFASIFFLILLTVLTVFFYNRWYNNDVVSQGKLFFDLDDQSYSYDFETDEKRAIQVEGYKEISNYTPFENGFCAVGYKNIEPGGELLKGDIICKKDGVVTVFDNEFKSSNLNLINDNIVFTTGDENLIAINVFTRKRFTVDEGVYNYLVFGSDVCYFVADYEHDDTSVIFITNDLKSKTKIGNGNLKCFSENSFIYENDKGTYEYSLKTKKSVPVNSYKKNKYKEYVGEFEKTDISVYSYTYYFGDENSYELDYYPEGPYRYVFFRGIVLKKNNKNQLIKLDKEPTVYITSFFDGKEYYNLQNNLQNV